MNGILFENIGEDGCSSQRSASQVQVICFVVAAKLYLFVCCVYYGFGEERKEKERRRKLWPLMGQIGWYV